MDTEGLVIARFDHRTSRAGDPQKHSHLLVSSRVRCTDGKWRALDSKALHAQLKPCTRRHFGRNPGPASGSPGARSAGTARPRSSASPEGLLRFWSKRRRSIEARAKQRIAKSEAALGRALTDAEVRVAYQKATLKDRPTKGAGSEVADDLHARWRAEASEAGLFG